ncbi:hypothetical protein KCP76_16040 [Salmonella enterica subsp. enterica serovar Weltevreden]|nr:hypothetical protein KCP76_16040 [Salmonella enterica subsp. enterica serovar Weltevreden]
MDDAPDENEALKRMIDAAKMPKEAKRKEAELAEAEMMSPDVGGSDRGARLLPTGWCRCRMRVARSKDLRQRRKFLGYRPLWSERERPHP